MTLTQKQEVPHRHAHETSTAARTGQFTGALLVAGGVAALALRRHNGVRAGLTGLVMASTFQAHPRSVLAIAAHGERGAGPGGRPPGTPRWPKGPSDSVARTLAAGPGGRPPGTPWGADGAWAASRQAPSRGSYPAVRRRPEA